MISLRNSANFQRNGKKGYIFKLKDETGNKYKNICIIVKRKYRKE